MDGDNEYVRVGPLRNDCSLPAVPTGCLRIFTLGNERYSLFYGVGQGVAGLPIVTSTVWLNSPPSLAEIDPQPSAEGTL